MREIFPGWELVQVYLGDYNEMMPEVAEMPSLELNSLPRLCDVFETYVKTTQIFLCPSDPEGKYYTSEGCSYEYNTHLGGRKISEDMLYKELGISKTFVMRLLSILNKTINFYFIYSM